MWNIEISKHINNTQPLSQSSLSEYKFVKSNNKDKCINQIGELYYGSFPKILGVEWKTVKIRKRMQKWIERRNSTIIETLSTYTFKDKNNDEACNDELEFIVKEMISSSYNYEVSKQIGRQKEIFLSRKTIILYPFESILKLNSTRGRLYVLFNWKKLVDHPNFKNQINYHHVFGFTLDPESRDINKLLTDSESISRTSQEIKLELIGKIRLLILTYVRELKKCTIFRYKVEKKLSGQLQNNEAGISLGNHWEESAYLLLWCYMYIYGIIRHPRFDIDKNMRGLVVCESHLEDKTKIFQKIGCRCLYLWKTKDILESLKSKEYREKEVCSKLANYFELRNDGKITKLIEDKKEQFMSKFRCMMHDDQMIKTLEDRFKISLEELKESKNNDR